MFLAAQVDDETGKQKLVMLKVDPATGDVQLRDEVECIHAAVVHVTGEQFAAAASDPERAAELYRRTLRARSSENLKEVQLSWQEKFAALKSWVAGIAEAGTYAFRLQAEVEKVNSFAFAVAWKLMRFLARVDQNIMLEYVDRVGRECRHEGVLHEACLVANLIPVLDWLLLDLGRFISESASDDLLQLHVDDLERFRPTIAAIFDLHPPLKLFLHHPRYAVFLKYPEALQVPDFERAFDQEISFVRRVLLLNPEVTKFPRFRQFMSSATEPDPKVRALAAHHPRAADYPEFANFLSIATENSSNVRMVAARHPGAPDHPEFANFLSVATEPRSKVRKAAAANPGSTNFPQFANFLSARAEPDPKVRAAAAQNPGALSFPQYSRLLSDDEPNTWVRITATRIKQMFGGRGQGTA
ncbi:MAG: hypothetical protein Kow0069_24520 [Promethearchaeota archaeon]